MRSIRVRLEGTAVRTDPAGVCSAVVARVDTDRPDVVVCDVTALDGADVATIDALARIQLAVRRAGAGVVLDGVDDRLRCLLRLVGLAEVLPDADPAAERVVTGSIGADSAAARPVVAGPGSP
jgi:anti-anti-sigma regulatory factor